MKRNRLIEKGVSCFIILMFLFGYSLADTCPVALIRANTTTEETAESFRAMLDTLGCQTTIITLNQIEATDFSSFRTILIAPTQSSDEWFFMDQFASDLNNTGLPILGLGDAGYHFFGRFSLQLGYPNGMHFSDSVVVLPHPDQSIFHHPYPIEIPSADSLNLHVRGAVVGIPSTHLDTAVIKYASSYHIENYYTILQQNRYVLWGYNALPAAMGKNARYLLANLVHHLAESVPGNTLPDNWIFKSKTGNSATVVLPVAANPSVDDESLMIDDYVGVFSSAGLCCGWSQWAGENMAITVWGDDDQTPETDGMQVGDTLRYRVYRIATGQEWTDIAVDYSSGDPVYAANAYKVISQFSTREQAEQPILFVSVDFLQFGLHVDTLTFRVENHGTGTLSWYIDINPEKSWLTEVRPRAANVDTTVRVVVDPSMLDTETDSTLLIIYSNGGKDTISVYIQQPAALPDHWRFTAHTGNNATVVLPTDANPSVNGSSLEVGMYVGVFTPAGLCCGWIEWQQRNAAITVWGDNSETSAVDGFQSGEQLSFRVYDVATHTEWTEVNVTYSQGNGVFETNAFMVLASFTAVETSVGDREELLIPNEMRLLQNYPNPFNTETTLMFELSEPAVATIAIVDVGGHIVKEWRFTRKEAGRHILEWDGRSDDGLIVASGIYFCKLLVQMNNSKYPRYHDSKKLILLK